MKFLKKYESTAYFDVYVYQEDFSINVSENELDMLIKSGFDIYWDDPGGYRYDDGATDMLECLFEYRNVSKNINSEDFVKTKKYNI